MFAQSLNRSGREEILPPQLLGDANDPERGGVQSGSHTATAQGDFIIELDNGNSYFRGRGLNCVVDIEAPGGGKLYSLKLTKGAGSAWTLWHPDLMNA